MTELQAETWLLHALLLLLPCLQQLGVHVSLMAVAGLVDHVASGDADAALVHVHVLHVLHAFADVAAAVTYEGSCEALHPCAEAVHAVVHAVVHVVVQQAVHAGVDSVAVVMLVVLTQVVVAEVVVAMGEHHAPGLAGLAATAMAPVEMAVVRLVAHAHDHADSGPLSLAHTPAVTQVTLLAVSMSSHADGQCHSKGGYSRVTGWWAPWQAVDTCCLCGASTTLRASTTLSFGSQLHSHTPSNVAINTAAFCGGKKLAARKLCVREGSGATAVV